jgi:hypothetical protein
MRKGVVTSLKKPKKVEGETERTNCRTCSGIPRHRGRPFMFPEFAMINGFATKGRKNRNDKLMRRPVH